MPLESLQILMGHSDIEVTRRYARLTDKALEKDYFEAMKIIERGGYRWIIPKCLPDIDVF